MDDINIAWENTVDGGKFRCRVEQPDKQVVFEEGGKRTFDDSNTTGKLIVTVAETGEELLNEKTFIRAGAIFGPDVEDVYIWQNRCIEVIDAWLAKQPN